MKNRKCPRCGKNPAIIDTTYGVLPCVQCQREDDDFAMTDPPEFYSQGKQDRVQHQRDVHAKDILQPFEGNKSKPNRDFVEAYPDKRDDYFTREEIEKL